MKTLSVVSFGLRFGTVALVSFIWCGNGLSQITPVPLPDPKIAGFHYPEPEADVVDWIFQLTNSTSSAPDSAKKLYGHGWGLWTALTAETNQEVDGQKLRVFETWATPEDLGELEHSNKPFEKMVVEPHKRPDFQPFHQLNHRKGIRAGDQIHFAAKTAAENTVIGFVKFDPSAAGHILQQHLLSATRLNELLQGGAKGVMGFPVTSVALKPMFLPLSGAPVEGRYYRLPVWPGPPDPAKEFPNSAWKGWVWIDIKNGGAGKGAIDSKGAADGSSRTDATTYPVSSLINFRLSAQDAASANKVMEALGAAPKAAAGDFAVLVAMHVAGKEITRWTWQTFWWTPNPEDPHLPSSMDIAKLRPAELQGAPRNYAMALAYSMVAPVQPYVRGHNSGESVYVYNPWLEASFGPADLPDSVPGYSNGQLVGNNYGVQTNCMSCHGSANYTPKNAPLPTAPVYTGDRYIDLDDSRFAGSLQVDFLWSVSFHAK